MATVVEEPLKLSKKKIDSIVNDPEKSARAANLVYVTDTDPGITRVTVAEKFKYFFKDKFFSQ